jgi:hypothetical protein
VRVFLTSSNATRLGICSGRKLRAKDGILAA